jgi:hypothetical protein
MSVHHSTINYFVLKCSVLNSLYCCGQTYTIKCIVKETGTNSCSAIHLPKDICSMYRVLFTFGRLQYITHLQYVPGTVHVWKAAVHYTHLQYIPGNVHIWKAAVHYITAICTGYCSRLEGCCTLHIYSRTYIGFYLYSVF